MRLANLVDAAVIGTVTMSTYRLTGDVWATASMFFIVLGYGVWCFHDGMNRR